MADKRTIRRMAIIAVLAVLVSLIEVAAIALMVPLVELLSGGNLDDAGRAGQFVGDLVGDTTARSQTLIVLFLVVGLLVVKVIAAGFVRKGTIAAVTRGATTASANLFAAYLRAPLSFHAHRNSAAAARTSALSLMIVYNLGLLGVATVFVEACTVVCITLLLLVMSPLAAIVAVIYFGLAMIAFGRLVQRRTEELSRRRDDVSADSLATLQQGLGGLREIRLRGDEQAWTDRFQQTNTIREVLDRQLIFSAEFGRYYIEGTFFVGFALIASVQVLTRDEAAFAGLALMLAAGVRLLPSAGRLLYGVSLTKQGRGSSRIVTDELDELGIDRLERVNWDQQDGPETIWLSEPVSVQLRNVSYRYPGAQPFAVHDLNLTVAPGESLGIVGPSGSGKSTAVDLICGLVPPTSGEILFDGELLAPGRPRPRIAYVPQDVFLLEGSVSANIHFSDGPIDEVALARAIRLAQLDRWIESLPEGVNTLVGERGALVSGGQRQRIGIARALYLKPSVLILDEATSALDVEIEAELNDAIKSLGRSTTLIVVAHRLSTVRRCDRILVLEDGEVVGLDTYDDLRRNHARFSKWVHLAEAVPS